MAGNRVDKVANLLQQELADILLKKGKDWVPGVLISVSKVRVSTDLSVARIFLSIFPSDKAKDNLVKIQEHSSELRKELGLKLRHQLRIIPELILKLDDSLDYQDNIERLLRGEGENPIL